MSRIIIKNLPSYVTPARLKEHVSRKDGPGGTVTDVKVAQRPDGTSRRFAFIGFKTEAEAKKAQEWFDRTYLDTSRISVQIAEVSWLRSPSFYLPRFELVCARKVQRMLQLQDQIKNLVWNRIKMKNRLKTWLQKLSNRRLPNPLIDKPRLQ